MWKADYALASKAAMEAWREVYENLGPRHTNVAHWRLDLGWGVPESVVREYLRPEREIAGIIDYERKEV